jgi:hypothetical protein
VDKENFVRRFGLSFEKDVQWKMLRVCWIIFLGLLFSRLFWSRSTRFLSSLNLTFRERKIETDHDAFKLVKELGEGVISELQKRMKEYKRNSTHQ